MAKQYNNAQQQTADVSTAIVKRLETNLGLPDTIKSNLMAGGLSPNDIGVVAAACISTGIDPRLLGYSNNVPPVIRMMDMMKNHGYIPGEDFYVAVYKANVKLPDETGVPTKETAEVPTVVVMPSAARAVANMKEDGRLYGKSYHVATKEITGKEAREIFERDMPSGNYIEGKTRVVRATLKTFVAGIGALDTPGEEPVFYGFYSPSKKVTYNNKTEIKEDWNEIGKAKDNYSPIDIATKRAQTKAARYVTRTNYSRDNRAVDVRLAALVESANNRLVALENTGQLEVAFDSGMVDIDAEQAMINPPPPKQATAAFAPTPYMDEEFTSPPMDVQEATGAARQPEVVKKIVTNSDDLGFAWEEMQDIDANVGVDAFVEFCNQLDRDMLEADAAVIHDIRTSAMKGGLDKAALGRLIANVREIGGWQPGESHLGMDLAELAVRFLVGAGKEGDPTLYPARYLGSKIVRFRTQGDKQIPNASYDEGYATTVWRVCESIRDLTKMEVPA